MIIGRDTCHIHKASVRGRKFFHRRCISWSYRNRGYDVRIHRNVEVRIKVFRAKLNVKVSGMGGFKSAPMNKVVVKAFIIMILVYSAMKNRANGPAAYSTLNPDTSSDSPSVRSNGARFVSARVEINHIIAKGQVGKISHMNCWVVIRVDRVNEPFIRRTESRIIARVTS